MPSADSAVSQLSDDADGDERMLHMPRASSKPYHGKWTVA